MLMYQRSEQSGRTLIETIAYIMVMITITVTFGAAVSRGYYKYESSVVQQQLMDLKKIISNRYAAEGVYKNVKWKDLCNDNVALHSVMSKKACQKENPVAGHHIFDGSVKIGPGDGAGMTYLIEFDGLPQDICVQLGVISWNLTEGSDLDHMIINSTAWRWQNSPLSGEIDSGDKELPASVEDVGNACREGYSNNIKWYFN